MTEFQEGSRVEYEGRTAYINSLNSKLQALILFEDDNSEKWVALEDLTLKS